MTMMADPESRSGSTSGHIDQGVHHFPVRIYYEDTDAGGVVYHANYLRYAERARTEMMRLLGIEHTALLRDHGIGWTVRSLSADYLRPARLDDLLDVQTRIKTMTGARLALSQTIHRADPLPQRHSQDETSQTLGMAAKPPELVRIDVWIACVDVSGRPVRLPKAIGAAIDDRGLGRRDATAL